VNQGIQQQTTKNVGEANKNVDAFRSAVQNVQGVNTQAQNFQNIMAKPQLPTINATEAAQQLVGESGNTTFLTPSQTPIAAPSPGQVAALPVGTPKLMRSTTPLPGQDANTMPVGTPTAVGTEGRPVTAAPQTTPRTQSEVEKLVADQDLFNLYKVYQLRYFFINSRK
jgi:hypothetical protein